MELEGIISAARGERPVDRLLVNARIVNVFTAEVAPGAVAIAGDRIVGLGQYPAREVVDLGGRYLAPGLIDAHVHIESAMAGVSGFTRAVLPRGTTTVVADPHEMANVLGTRGIDYMLASSAGQPMNYFFSLPSCVPASELETAGARLEAGDLEPYFDHPQIVALAEMMNYPGVIHAAAAVLDKIRAARRHGKPVDGHAPGLTARDLQAYLAAGVASDHECTTAAEAREKLASGMRIMMREGTGAKNLIDLLPALTPRNSRRTMWCSDDRHLRDLLETGHIDHMIRQAIAAGVDPVTAIQMATLNPAEYFGLHHLGAIAPGRQADLVVFADLHAPLIEEVYFGGRRVALHGALEAGTVLPPPPAQPAAMRAPTVVDWSVPAGSGALRVIRIVPGQILTRHTQMPATINGGLTMADPQRDLLKLAVVERHTGSGRVGKGFVNGLGLRRGALASSVAHDAHNVVVAGTSDDEMQAAYAAVVAMGGGLAVACDGLIRARLPLPIAGLMTDAPAETVLVGQKALNRAAHELGAIPPDPFMTLSFLALPVIPELKLTDRGLVDVSRFDFVPLFCG